MQHTEQLELSITAEMALAQPKWNDPIPLVSPAGTLMAYACPQCETVCSAISGGTLESRVEASREGARSCCCCFTCGARLGRKFNMTCENCQAEAKRIHETMLPILERRAREQEAAFNAALAKSKNPYFAKLLCKQMGEISEEYYCSGWLDGLEFRLWDMVKGGNCSFGMGTVKEEEVKSLSFLSEQSGGWWMFDDKLGQQMFVSLQEWERMVEQNSNSSE